MQPNEISVFGKINLATEITLAISIGLGTSNLIFEFLGGIKAIKTIREGFILDSLINFKESNSL
ncbi:MAG: hypothetical protein ACFFAO_02260 [Candidatus Hermodarchaeota archaeon]